MGNTNHSLTLLAVHAHPDDEVIGTGGTLARYAAEGVRTALVCATLGEEGEVVDPSMDQEETKRRLAEIREGELRGACRVLGVQELRILGYRDSGMAGTPANQHPEAFCQADLNEATGRLVQIIRELHPQVMITYDENGGYRHPDHIMTHRVAVAAFHAAGDPLRYPEQGLEPWQPSKLYQIATPRSRFEKMREYYRQTGQPDPYDRPDRPIRRLGIPDALITATIDARQYLQQKRDALACHRTQISTESMFFKIPEDLASEGLGREHFILIRTLVSLTLPEDDLFAGLR